MDFDPVLLARLQFAFTISFHIIFPSFTIGLSAYIATLGVMALATGRERYRRIARFWTRIFAVSFGMGVVSGVVLSYELGTNWSRFSAVAGNVIDIPLRWRGNPDPAGMPPQPNGYSKPITNLYTAWWRVPMDAAAGQLSYTITATDQFGRAAAFEPFSYGTSQLTIVDRKSTRLNSSHRT